MTLTVPLPPVTLSDPSPVSVPPVRITGISVPTALRLPVPVAVAIPVFPTMDTADIELRLDWLI